MMVDNNDYCLLEKIMPGRLFQNWHAMKENIFVLKTSILGWLLESATIYMKIVGKVFQKKYILLAIDYV